ncbi:unnamed protein product [Cuscuta campestris]|uniref:L-gulonolactone oxidase n=1 Tax=Cuscuta campestris TaxID=132261 RepID=A0A484M768_9ASTE|nr:unnamed protein product [Cuscuta campestris]
MEVDVERREVTADAGAGLRELITRVEEDGLSLVASPYWEGVSVGGVISTGAHGSSWWGKGGAVHDHVTAVSLVVPAEESEGYAKVRRFTAGDSLLNAVKLSLGLLGVISKVTFSLEPAFKRSITYNFTDDNGVENEYIEHAKKHEFADLQWYPSRNTAVYRYDHRVPLDTPGDGVNDFIGFRPNFIPVTQIIRAAEKSFERKRDVKGKCMAAGAFIASKELIANGLKNNDLVFTGYPVVGRQGKMQTSGSCLYTPESDWASSCAWDPRTDGLFFYESTAVFPAEKFEDFVRDVKALRDAVGPASFCRADMYNGRRPDTAAGYEVWDEVEQMAFFKHGARLHWAKNRNVAFKGVLNKYPGFARFLDAKKRLDPKNLFSNEWSEEAVFGKSTGNGDAKGDGCALEGLCVCSKDRHCSPSNGYFCRKGIVYKNARVCTYLSNFFQAWANV